MNGLPAVAVVAAVLVGLGSLVLMWADERWTRRKQELYASCRCAACRGVRR